MRRVNELPLPVCEMENIWIPLRDGVRLAARVWLPETTASQPVPAVLEYIPYRKRDMTSLRDGATHGYLAGHGYACVRLDVRGIGDSEGLYGDQFTAGYVDDADRGDLLAGAPTLVQRRCRDVRAFLGSGDRAADGGAPACPAQDYCVRRRHR